MKRLLIAFTVAAGLFSCAVAQEDAYDTMARDLCGTRGFTKPRVAVVPFPYLDKRASDGGVVIAERLTTRLAKLNRCKVVDLQVVQGAMRKLNVHAGDLGDLDAMKQLGRELGANILVMGTLNDVGAGRTEVNARAVSTETADIINTTSAEVARTWQQPAAPAAAAVPAQQTAVPAAQPQTIVQVQYMPPPAQQVAAQPPKTSGFVDVYLGAAWGIMNTTFDNHGDITGPDLNLDLGGVTYDKLELRGAEAKQSTMPYGLRFVGFTRNWGGAYEISHFSLHLDRQTTTAHYNGSRRGHYIDIPRDDYIRVDVFTPLSGDVMVRFSEDKVQPYVGLGMGMTVNTVSSSSIYGDAGGVYEQGFTDRHVGILFRAPIGVRVVLSPVASLFAEYRPTYNTFHFDRGNIGGESDTITMHAKLLLFGASLRF